MPPESRTERADRVISALATRQHGVVSKRQLARAGVTSAQVKDRLRLARLHPLHHGVYLVGHRAPPRYALEAAALLACGDGAVLSHRSAAALWELVPHVATQPVDVTLPHGRTAVRAGITAHRSRLDGHDIRRRHGLAVTSAARTILDLAPELPSSGGHGRLSDLEQLVAEAHYGRLAGEAELRDQLDRNPGRAGTPALRAILGLPGGPGHTRSGGERAMLRLLRAAGIAGFEVNARTHGYEVDFLWRDLDFAVELDGYAAHSGPVAFERDRLKVARLKVAGVDVMPVTSRRLRDDPQGVRAQIVQALEHARRRRRTRSA